MNANLADPWILKHLQYLVKCLYSLSTAADAEQLDTDTAGGAGSWMNELW